MKANEKMATTPKAKTKAVDNVENLSTKNSAAVDKLSADAIKAQRIKNLNRKGKPKGAKSKSTKVREAMEVKTTGLVAAAKILPLDVMLTLMGESFAQFRALQDAPPAPQIASADDKDRQAALDAAKAHYHELKAARAATVELAIAAAPYCHAKLQSIDKSVKRNVRVQVISFADAPPLTEKAE